MANYDHIKGIEFNNTITGIINLGYNVNENSSYNILISLLVVYSGGLVPNQSGGRIRVTW